VNFDTHMKHDFEVRKSKIAGNGEFATKTILKNMTICFLEGELCTLDEVIRRVNAGEEEASDPLGVGVEQYIDLDEVSRTFNHG